MADQPGVVGPMNFPVRDPRNPSQVVGRIVNFVRYVGFGGFYDAAKYESNINTTRAGGGINSYPYQVEKPTNVKAAENTSERKV